MHIPVLLKEVIEVLDPKQGEFFIDGTLGGGGYSALILKKIGPIGKLLVVDWDKTILEKAKEKIEAKFQIIWVNDNFANLPEILKKRNLGKANGLVLDLGFSSAQIEESGRGFSFMKNEPLIMTYSDEMVPVKDILKRLSEKALREIIKKFSDEKFSMRIAKAIKFKQKIKPIQTTRELAEVIKSAVPKNYERGRINPATRTFQALRIYANKELENLEKVLKGIRQILKPGARIAIVSFHSLEDRLVKKYFSELARDKEIELITKKPITPQIREIKDNPKSRSAKLRAALMRY